MPRVVHIQAPSRLHFGLWSLGGGSSRQFGGVGAMIQLPGIQLRIAPAESLTANGPLAERAVLFARRWAEFHRRLPPKCQIHIISAPPQHTGLGTGTQLALSIAAGLNAFAGMPCHSPQELALTVGRGLRSAVGTYGFVHGGLIIEQGKLSAEPISPLDCRISLPDAWRFVLVRPRGLCGLAGEDESAAIASLPAIPESVTRELIAEVRDALVPAAATSNFIEFARSVYRYGYQSGMAFAPRQGGPYNGPVLTELVERIRSLGHEGVGQSSWGPTLLVVQPDQQAAEAFVSQMSVALPAADIEFTITPPANAGAIIRVTEDC